MASNRERLFAASDVIEAGAWRAELRNDEIAVINYAGVPVVRGIRAVIRDRDWQTLVPAVRAVQRSASAEGFCLLLEVEFEGFGCRYNATLSIVFSVDSLEVVFEGESPADFHSNRIGLVVLHRTDEAGRDVLIGETSGGHTPSRFPVDISPHQPFRNVATMQWQRDGVDLGWNSGAMFSKPKTSATGLTRRLRHTAGHCPCPSPWTFRPEAGSARV
jgi:hypothetical protein